MVWKEVQEQKYTILKFLKVSRFKVLGGGNRKKNGFGNEEWVSCKQTNKQKEQLMSVNSGLVYSYILQLIAS